MEKLTTFTGIVVPFDRAHVDTDQIFPKQFLKLVQRTGFGRFLFSNQRFLGDGSPDPEFVLNDARFEGGEVLLARENFGCGSSREHAPWALHDYGFRAIVAPSIADIFRNNCVKTGILPVVLDASLVSDLFRRVQASPGYRLTVSLEEQTLTAPDGFSARFVIDAFSKRCLLEGLDQIGLTLEHEDAVRDYEATQSKTWQTHISGSLPEEVPGS
jgi:3-isopropylmalate/(R)-2-methylmalate dehydratase small subunit